MIDTARRRQILAWLASVLAAPALPSYGASAPRKKPPPVAPGYRIIFPRDHASHPEFRTEWWYITGWLQAAAGEPLGFQITFFRTRNRSARDNPSAFAPHQILLAHAALTDPRAGRLQHDERIARQGFGLAGAEAAKTAVWIDDWSLAQEKQAFRASVAAADFKLELAFNPTQPPLLHGTNGLSRKGRSPGAASHYYSLPHLAVAGTLARNAGAEAVTGSAWLDHEWSNGYMEAKAVGWDWVGINAEDGGALMAFRMRDAGGAARWAGATYRGRDGATRVFGPGDVSFVPRRDWRSPRTGVRYPVAFDVKAGDIAIALEPLLDDQENDVRRSTGTIYWEGAVRATSRGRPFGRGYLELTGYWKPLKL